MKTNVTTLIKKDTTITLTYEDLIGLLAARGYSVPDNASIFVRVPGGGDWSNTDLDINKDSPIYIQYETVEIPEA